MKIENKEIENFFENLIDKKIELTNELFLEAVQIQKKEMREYIANDNDESNYFLEDEDLATYVEALHKEKGLLYANDFDIVVAENDRTDAIFKVFNSEKYGF